MDKILGQEDYFKGYQDNIDELRKDSDQPAFDKMCHEALGTTEQGKELLKFLTDRVVMASVPAKLGEGYGEACVYFEGYREAYRQLIHGVKSYPERKKAEEAAKLRGDK